MGRKRIEIDLAEVERLAGLGMTQEEIAEGLGISVDTLERRKKNSAGFANALTQGFLKTKIEIGNKLYEMAIGGDLGAIIWFEKTRFGYPLKQKDEGGVIIRIVDESS